MGRHDTIRYRDKVCPACEAVFTPNTGRRVYCSEACRRGRATCLGCGKRFVRTRTGSSYCSSACWYKAPGKKELKSRACEECRQEFQPRDSTVRFCSRECSHVARRRKRQNTHCATCGKLLIGDVGRKVKYCSFACAHTGRSHANYGRVLPEGGKRLVTGGYVEIKVDGKWVKEHRHAMEQKLGRPLARSEHVHHLNGRKDDNRPDNLELWKKAHPYGVRGADYHCAGCRCYVLADRRIIPH